MGCVGLFSFQINHQTAVPVCAKDNTTSCTPGVKGQRAKVRLFLCTTEISNASVSSQCNKGQTADVIFGVLDAARADSVTLTAHSGGIT